MELAAEQGQLPPDYVTFVGNHRHFPVVRRDLSLEKPLDHHSRSCSVLDISLLPGADIADDLSLPIRDRIVELPIPATDPTAHGRSNLSGGNDEPG